MEQKQIDFIDKRNKLLVSLISKLKLGIHILNFPEKPMFYSADYSIEYSGYVKNFELILNTRPHDDGEETFTMKLSNETINNDEKIEQIRFIFQDWMNNCTHLPVWTVKVKDMRLYLSGFNHHDKLNRKSPYPVFSEYYPYIYFDEEKKYEIVNRFSNNNIELE